MNDRIAEYCKKLRLSSAFAENAVSLTAESNQEYMLKILEAEIEQRWQKKCLRNLKQAGFDQIKTFENYQFDRITFPNLLPQEEMRSLSFLDRAENLIFYGRNGAGKSHMATAIGVEACMRGKTVKFYKTADLVNELIAAKEAGTLPKLLNKLKKTDLLICDEWGYLPFDAEGSQLLFQVIANSYENRSLIITTNIEFSKWNGIFYDDQLTAALLDRLIHHSHLIVFDRDSWRFEHSLMKESS